jgi:hypothetical protein
LRNCRRQPYAAADSLKSSPSGMSRAKPRDGKSKSPAARASSDWVDSRPLLQHARPLPDGQPDPRPVLDGALKYLSCPAEISAGRKHVIDLSAPGSADRRFSAAVEQLFDLAIGATRRSFGLAMTIMLALMATVPRGFCFAAMTEVVDSSLETRRESMRLGLATRRTSHTHTRKPRSRHHRDRGFLILAAVTFQPDTIAGGGVLGTPPLTRRPRAFLATGMHRGRRTTFQHRSFNVASPKTGGCDRNPETVGFVWNCGDQTNHGRRVAASSAGCFASAVKGVVSAA